MNKSMASKKNNVDCYRLEKDVFAKTIAASRASAYALAIFSKNPLVGEAPPIPQQGPLCCPAKRSTGGAATRPCGR